MKKAILMFCMAMSLFATNVVAQEVRGVETRIALYNGESYDLMYEGRNYDYKFAESTEYYGFEFKNLNSISVSVAIEVYKKGNPDKMIDTKEIVLKSKESYIHKYPIIPKYQGKIGYQEDRNKEKLAISGSYVKANYYVKYKAFKLQ